MSAATSATVRNRTSDSPSDWAGPVISLAPILSQASVTAARARPVEAGAAALKRACHQYGIDASVTNAMRSVKLLQKVKTQRRRVCPFRPE
ncbi:hypothetical protein Acsp02_27000 [Actinoplanes sp. NBRC 103695]|nr:hypothetical protein Acsp02_27000 [Actinoplanes sp. NBRC 103695]